LTSAKSDVVIVVVVVIIIIILMIIILLILILLLTTLLPHAQASLVVANMAQVSAGSAVLDPFCGTGGLLLAAAAFGANTTVGVDVNASVDVSRVASNFHHLGLTPPRAYLFGDVTTPEVQARVAELGPFDAIITDPPYGKRERGSERALGATQEAVWALMEMAVGGDTLRVGGRLVFFLPVHPMCRDPVPLVLRHPCLELRDASRQVGGR
jgi:tRNA G10  N-methylase Trm11